MSYQIKSNLPVSGSHWGLIFRDGIAVTEDKRLAERLKERGYEVIVDAAISVEAQTEDKTVDAAVEEVPASTYIETLSCPKCGKEYKSAPALEKHIGKCEAE